MEQVSEQSYLGKVNVHNGGHVVLERISGDELDIVNAARVSFGHEDTVLDEKNKGLINFLLRERHMSPFEHVQLFFDIKCPIFVARQFHRHRTQSINEWSGRYSEINQGFYIPEEDYIREQKGKPGQYFFEEVDDSDTVAAARTLIMRAQTDAFHTYRALLDMGVAKEVCRSVLPQGAYTRYKFSMNLRNFLHFLSLRAEAHTQQESRDYAEAMEELLKGQMPFIVELFNEHGRRV